MLSLRVQPSILGARAATSAFVLPAPRRKGNDSSGTPCRLAVIPVSPIAARLAGAAVMQKRC
jgi:hypothetical protein